MNNNTLGLLSEHLHKESGVRGEENKKKTQNIWKMLWLNKKDSLQ